MGFVENGARAHVLAHAFDQIVETGPPFVRLPGQATGLAVFVEIVGKGQPAGDDGTAQGGHPGGFLGFVAATQAFDVLAVHAGQYIDPAVARRLAVHREIRFGHFHIDPLQQLPHPGIGNARFSFESLMVACRLPCFLQF